MKYFKKLVGERIYLSLQSTDDAEIFAQWMNDFNVTDYTGRSHNIYTLEYEKEYLTKTKENSQTLGIVEKDTDKLIGTIGLKKCGFKESGRRRKCRFINGKYYDIITMDILAEEFKDSYIKNKNIK